MFQIIYELCEDDKGTWGYGVFTDDGVVELSLEEVLELMDKEEFVNAEIRGYRIKFNNLKHNLPKFRKSDYEPLDEDVPIYVVCKCRVGGKKGYLVVSPLCKLEFIDRYELINLCMDGIVCNVYLKPLLNDNSELFPIQYNIPFKYIGDIELD